MALREILTYPDKRLRQLAQPVTKFDKKLSTLVGDMTQTMYTADGIGLAAVQIDVAQRVVVMDLSEEKNQPQVFINPVLSNLSGSVETQEGCLSVPEIYADVTRAESVTINAQDVKGDSFEIQADEILSICIQHEVDHLDGKVFVDYLSRLKRDRIRKKLLKEARQKSA